VWVVVFVADQDALTCPSHAMFLVVLFESLQAREYGGVFFWLAIFRAECVVAQRVEAYSLGLFCVEVLGKDGAETFQW
jgi:uncharacterized membrane-anchored protein